MVSFFCKKKSYRFRSFYFRKHFCRRSTRKKSAWVPLDQLNASEQATVVSIHGEGAVRRRLMDMGVTKNVQIYVRKLAPLGDPVEITLRGYELTLRKKKKPRLFW